MLKLPFNTWDSLCIKGLFVFELRRKKWKKIYMFRNITKGGILTLVLKM